MQSAAFYIHEVSGNHSKNNRLHEFFVVGDTGDQH